MFGLMTHLSASQHPTSRTWSRQERSRPGRTAVAATAAYRAAGDGVTERSEQDARTASSRRIQPVIPSRSKATLAAATYGGRGSLVAGPQVHEGLVVVDDGTKRPRALGVEHGAGGVRTSRRASSVRPSRAQRRARARRASVIGKRKSAGSASSRSARSTTARWSRRSSSQSVSATSHAVRVQFGAHAGARRERVDGTGEQEKGRIGVAHPRLRAGTDAGDPRAAPVPVGPRHHPGREARHPLRPALVQRHRQGILGALMVQELPAQREPGQARDRVAGVRESGHALGELAERDLAAGLARVAVHRPGELAVCLGGVGLLGEQRDGGGVVAEQERRDRRVRGGPAGMRSRRS